MDRIVIAALLLWLAACSDFPQRATDGSVCHHGEVSYDCDTGPFR